MKYEGALPDSKINWGSQPADPYGLMTQGGLDTLKKYGNLLISINTLDNAIKKAAEIKFKKHIGDYRNKTKVSNRLQALIGQSVNEVRSEVIRLTGFRNISLRKLDPYVKDDPICFIIEESSIGDPFYVSQ